MNPLLIGPLIDIGRDLINRIFPDKVAQAEQRAAADLELIKMTQTERMADKANDMELALSQTKINEVEAASEKVFVSGWRPFIGWICGAGFGIQYVVIPLLSFALAVGGHQVELYKVDFSEMMPVLLGILGLGGLRTYEKIKATR